MYLAIVIVPVKVYFDIFFSGVIHRETIVAFEGVNEVIGIVVRGVLDAEIIDREGELDRVCVMFPQSRNKGALVVSSFVEALL
jgi:hypothetical protein